MKTDLINRLERVFQNDIDDARENLMLRNDNGDYYLFDRFTVCETAHSVDVYRRGECIHRFGSLRVAVSWCIAEKYGQTELATEIVRLDQDCQRLQATMHVDSEIASRIRDRERRHIVQTKSQDSRYRLDIVKNRLTKCVMRAKYFQIRGFNNEIARTRRPAPHRTGRPGTRKSGG